MTIAEARKAFPAPLYAILDNLAHAIACARGYEPDNGWLIEEEKEAALKVFTKYHLPYSGNAVEYARKLARKITG